MDKNEIKYRPKMDPEFFDIKHGVDVGKFVDYMKGRSLENIRLPLNNPEAFSYLCWLNEFWVENYDGCHLNYLLNLWSSPFGDKPVRPPTAREMAIYNARRIVKLADNTDLAPSDKEMYIDVNAEGIRDAYHYWCYPIWIASGLAGCVLKWGTFEDNEKPGDEDKYVTYEKYEDNDA